MAPFSAIGNIDVYIKQAKKDIYLNDGQNPAARGPNILVFLLLSLFPPFFPPSLSSSLSLSLFFVIGGRLGQWK